MVRYARLFLWRLLAILALVVGIVGIALPVLPTVPFLIVAAWAAGKSSPQLERWLISHPTYGHHIRAWRERNVIPRRAKWFATLAMTGSAIMLQFAPVPQSVSISIPLVMAAVALWLWRQPDA
jgi:uncharacterized membrane protein YbaN (DUF454 family)